MTVDPLVQIKASVEAIEEERLVVLQCLQQMGKARDPRLPEAIAAAHTPVTGIKLQDIGDWLGVSRERARQLEVKAAHGGQYGGAGGLWFTSLRGMTELPELIAAYLCDVRIMASAVRGKTPADDPGRAAGHLTILLMSALRARGHTAAQIGQAAGVTPHAVAARLRGVPYMPLDEANHLLDSIEERMDG